MFKLEKEFRADYNLIAGVDEAGRGPLAGPVVAGAVIFKNIPKIKNLKDSKLLKAQEREEIFEKIKLSALEFQISICDVEYINQNNILRATLKAMQDAVLKLKTIPELILIDGTFTIPQI
ncbi:MAG: ribonuclease HII, partial [Armatimonadetes bacterium]|nr:ribonuclease HII [Armatimonadota bacterium]